MTVTAPLPHHLPARAAIFDFDGTLAKTAHIWQTVDSVFLSRRGIPLTPDYPQRLSALGFVEGASYTIERYGLAETVEEVCAEWTKLSRELYQSDVRLRAGAEAYLLGLRAKGIPLALATTNDAEVLAGMQHVRIHELFDATVHAAEVGHGKDRPDIFVEAASRLGVDPSDCIIFDDIVPAARSAHAVGAQVCGVFAHDPAQQVDELKRCADWWLDEWSNIGK